MLYGTTLSAPFGLRSELAKMFDEAVAGGGRRMSWAPVVDIREDEREIAIVAELPGLRPEQVEVTCENGVLDIRGEKSEDRKEDEQARRYHLIERTYGGFSRSFQLPQGLDESKIEATFDNGVLTVHVPKAAHPSRRRFRSTSARIRRPANPRLSRRGQAGPPEQKRRVPWTRLFRYGKTR